MKIFIKKYEDCLRQVFVHFGSAEIDKAYEEAFAVIQKKAQMPGFRQGKVPIDMIEKNFPDDVMNEIIRSLVVKAADQLHEDGENLYSEPRFNPQKHLSKNSPFTFSLVFESVPEVLENIDPEKIVLEFEEYYYDDKMIDQTIMKEVSNLEKVKGKIEEDDMVTVSVGNESYTGDKEIVLSSKIVTKLAGFKTGDKVSLSFSDLDTYTADIIGSLEGDCLEGEIVKVERPAPPALTDELVEQVSPHKTVALYRESVRKRFEQTMTGLNDASKKNALAEYFSKNTKVEFPKSEFLRGSKEEAAKFLEGNFFITEISLGALLTDEKIKSDFSSLLTKTYDNIVFYFATKDIAEKYSIKPDQSLIDRIARSHAREHDQSLDEFKQKSSRDEWENVLEAAKMDATLQFLMKKAEFKAKTKLPLIKINK